MKQPDLTVGSVVIPPSPSTAVVPHSPATVDPVADMLRAITERGVTPETVATLDKALDIYERMNAKRAEAAFSRDMAVVQSTLPNIVRTATNAFTKSRYATLERINEAVIPIYTQYGFGLTFGEEPSSKPDAVRIVCDVSHREGHTKRYHAEIPMDGAGAKGIENKSRTHAYGSTVSYGRRYLLCLIFNLTLTNEDDDGNGGSQTITQAQADDLRKRVRETAGDEAAFLRFAGATSYEAIPANKYGQCDAALRRKERTT